MYQVTAHAVRKGKMLEVTVSGFLPNSCYYAKITDYYPGGKIKYIRDPEVAQVFITESVKPSVVFCSMALVPWSSTISLRDDYHKEVEILINNREVLQIPIVESGSQFIVLQLVGGIIPDGAYSIIPDGVPYLAIYGKVFGPDSYANCMKWIQEKSTSYNELFDALSRGENLEISGNSSNKPKSLFTSGGGSGNPKGL